MRIPTGYMPPTDGRATVAGYDVFTHPVEAKRRTGYLPETPPLYPDMTVREYLDFVARIKGVPPKEQKDRVADGHEARTSTTSPRSTARSSRKAIGSASASRRRSFITPRC